MKFSAPVKSADTIWVVVQRYTVGGAVFPTGRKIVPRGIIFRPGELFESKDEASNGEPTKALRSSITYGLHN